MLKIYLIGLAITVLWVCFCWKMSDTKIENLDDVKYLLFCFAFWFITMPVIMTRVVVGICKDCVNQRG